MSDFPLRHPGDIYSHIPHDFPPQRPGQGGGGGGGGSPSDDSDWAKLCRGKTLGKSVNIQFAAAGFGRQSANFMELRGEDREAIQLSLVLSPPKVFPGVPAVGTNIEQMQGPFQDYAEIAAAAGFTMPKPGAIIEWGIGGVSNRIEVDIGNGLALNLGGASFLRTTAFVDEPQVIFLPTTGVFQLSGFVNPGRCKNTGATRTVDVGAIGAGLTSTVQPIPRMSRGVTLISAGQYVAEIQFLADRSAVNVLGNVLVAFNTGNINYVPIPNGAYYFQVVSTAACDNVQAVFDLAI